MDILILGNGFDLAHGLKTRYTDFLDYCIKNKILENIWLMHFINKQQKLGDKWIDLEKEIYNVIKEINEKLKCITNNYEKEIISQLYNCYIDENFDLSKINKGFSKSSIEYPTNEKEYGIVGNFYYFKTYKGLIKPITRLYKTI